MLLVHAKPKGKLAQTQLTAFLRHAPAYNIVHTIYWKTIVTENLCIYMHRVLLILISCTTPPDSSIQISIKVVIFILVIELALVLVLHGIHCTEYTQLNSPHPQEEQRWYIKQKTKQEKFIHLFGGVFVLEEPPAKGLAHIARIMDVDQSSNPDRRSSQEKEELTC
jgi:hypothetical protein